MWKKQRLSPTGTEVSRCWNGPRFEPVNPQTVNIELGWVQGEQEPTDNDFKTHCWHIWLKCCSSNCEKMIYDCENESLGWKWKKEKTKTEQQTDTELGYAACMRSNIMTQLKMDWLQDPADSQKIIRARVTGGQWNESDAMWSFYDGWAALHQLESCKATMSFCRALALTATREIQ